jgi:CBS domain-containing protein
MEQDQPGGELVQAFDFIGSSGGGVTVTSTGKTPEADMAYIEAGETLRHAGQQMRQLAVAALPVCGEDGKFQGIITRGMIVEAIAAGEDPKIVTVRQVASMC